MIGRFWRPLRSSVCTFAAILLSAGVLSATEPEEIAEAFLQHLIQGKRLQALELIDEADRAMEAPIGRFRFLVETRPRFPSLWEVVIVSVEKDEDEATVGITMRHPEIEISLRDVRIPSSALEEMALQRYFEDDLPRASTDVSVNLVSLNDGAWLVSTGAEKDAWYRELWYPPEADVGAMNKSEILEFRERLTETFPARSADIAELVDPKLAILDAADGLRFEEARVVDDRLQEPRAYQEPAYEVSLTVVNGSPHTVGRISAALVFRNAAGEIVETGAWILSNDDLPEGLKSGDRYKSIEGLRIENPSEKATQVEVQLKTVDLR